MRFSSRLIAIASGLVLLAWLAWLAIVLNSVNSGPFSGKDAQEYYSRLGTFGDSFGIIGSLMAALAASGAFYAFSEQREDMRLQQFERNFYSLFDHFQEIVKQIDIIYVSWKSPEDKERDREGLLADRKVLYAGREALRDLLNELRASIAVESYNNSKIVAIKYDEFFDKWMDDLGHYFRTLYHLFRMIRDDCPNNKVKYSRIVRAHLSNSEQCLIAYNCICGEGRFAFVNLLEEFSVLHNIHRRNLN